MSSQQIHISIDLGDATFKVGKLWVHQSSPQQKRASFEYEPGWLKHSEKFAIDPALQLTEGSFHTKQKQTLFGSIGDSAPDSWGRRLMRLSESKRAKSTGETTRKLLESDYLLGVNDEARQGALRFSLEDGGPYLTPKHKKSIPPLMDLPRLLSATERCLDYDETAEDLKILLALAHPLVAQDQKHPFETKTATLLSPSSRKKMMSSM